MLIHAKYVIRFNLVSILVISVATIIHYGFILLLIIGFCKVLVSTSHGTKHVLVMVEHFSKWIELVALLQNSSKLVVIAFFYYVLVYFGTLNEVLTVLR